ncbi:MAG: serine hydrolase domain-containing protein [Planctomycetota bacterium]
MGFRRGRRGPDFYAYLGLVLLLVALDAPFAAFAAVILGYLGWLGLRASRPSEKTAGLARLEVPDDATEAERIARIEAWLEAARDSKTFNGGVLIARGGEPLLMRTFGVADPKGERPLTTSTPFRLASVSKQFTAAAVLTLVRDGRVALDQPVVELLPDLPHPEVTVRHLLNQTSGIPDAYMRLAKKRKRALGGRLRIADVPGLLAHARIRSRRTPGAHYEYSNTDYVLAAAVVEAASGTPFEAYLREALFEPLGMNGSRVWNRESGDDFPERAIDFVRFPLFGVYPLDPMWFDGVSGDGGVFASLEDLLVWERFWREPELLPAELVEECFRGPTLANGETSDYGFGWALDFMGPWHNGAWLGARTFVARTPANDGWLAVVDNAANEATELFALQLRLQLETLR